jgi:VCBS repeat-containing protein
VYGSATTATDVYLAPIQVKSGANTITTAYVKKGRVGFAVGSPSEAAVIRRHVAIAPAPAVAPPTPPVVANDAGETTADETASGNVLTNDDDGLIVVAVNGLVANVGAEVAGDNGGVFVIDDDGAWTFDPDGDFADLEGEESEETAVTYHASDGVSESAATLTVTVTAVAASALMIDGSALTIDGSPLVIG